jgi:hypothetical protein
MWIDVRPVSIAGVADHYMEIDAEQHHRGPHTVEGVIPGSGLCVHDNSSVPYGIAAT